MTTAPAILRGDAIPAEIMPSLTPGREAVQIGAWVADPGDDSLTRAGERVKLEPRMMKLLLRFAKEPGVVVSQEQLLESVWSGVVVSTASVYQSISQLRKVLGDIDDTPQYIETVARKGYRLIAPVAPATLKTPEPPPELTASSAATSAPADPRTEPAPGSPAAEVRVSQRRLTPIVVVLVALLVFASLAYWKFRSPTPSLQAAAVNAATNSILSAIVVLPFVDMSPGGQEQAFCDGLTEEMSNWLAQIPTLRVVARTSAFEFRNKNEDVRSIGKKLGTSHVIEGSLRRAGNKMRITVQLIDTRNGYHLWSGSYDVESSNVLEVQEQVARAVANNLELRLTAATTDRFADRRSANAAAYPLYLVAKSHMHTRTQEGNDQAIALFRQTLTIDPDFALAQVGLAHAHLNERYLKGRDINDIAADATPLLAAAAKHAPNLAEVYVERGALQTELRMREEALRDLKFGLKLNPNLRAAASELGFYYLTNGEPREALDYYTRALSIDPLDFGLHAKRCLVLSDLGQGDAAAEACERARALRPEAPWAFANSSLVEFARGQLVPAVKLNDEALSRDAAVAEIQGDRAAMMLALGLPERAGEVFARSYAQNAEGTRATYMLAAAGALSAFSKGGAAGVRNFITQYQLDDSKLPAVIFELANAALFAGDHKLARELVDRGLETEGLMKEDVASPWTARDGRSYLLIAAAAKRATGDEAGAKQHLDELDKLLDRLVESGVERFGLYQLRAETAAMRGDEAAAIRELQRAAKLGWREVWSAKQSPYFAKLRGNAEFDALITTLKASNEEAVRTLFAGNKKPAKT
jgi:TolB-like protein/DNA-binding winged helix-turn-helix (wHTH) protein/Flp pilus assembly protein TadD